MKKQFTYYFIAMLFGLVAINFQAQAADKYAQSDITWATGPWYNAPVGGDVVSSPTAGDNVFTQDWLVTIDANAICDNFTYGKAGTVTADKVRLGEGVTLTIRGTLGCTVYQTNDAFLGSHATSVLKFTGEALTGSGPYLLMTNNASRSLFAKNIIVQTTDSKEYRLFASRRGGDLDNDAGDQNKISLNTSTGKIIIKSGSYASILAELTLGQNPENELIVEEGATLYVRNVRGGGANTHIPATKVTINGTLLHENTSGFTVKDLVLGANAKFVTNAGSATQAERLTWDSWWGAASQTNPVGYGQFATPASFTIAEGATIEFNRTSAQHIQGVIPANRYFVGTTTATYPGVTADTELTPSYSIPYSNIILSGASAKTIQSNLVAKGNITINAGTLVLPAGKVLVTSGVVDGTVGDAGFTKNGAVIYLSASNAAMGKVTATIGAGNLVTLVATPNAGYKLDNFTEGASVLASNPFTPDNGTVRTIVANFSADVSTSTKSLNNAQTYATVVGKAIQLHGDIQFVELFDTQGRRLVAEQKENTIAVNTNGIYIIKMHTKNGVINQKISIQ